GGVSIDSLGAGIPGSDDSSEGLADNGVDRRFHNGGQACLRPFGFTALGAVAGFAMDGKTQAAKVMGPETIDGAGIKRPNPGFAVRHDDDSGYVGVSSPQGGERVQRAEARIAMGSYHQLECMAGERSVQRFSARNACGLYVNALALQLL